jgi:sorbitol-specific phosphotransferase system component IIBC
LIWVDVVLIRISIGVVLVFNLGAVVGSWLLYKRLSATQHAQSVLANMEQQYSMLKAWQELYLRLSLLLYPISAAAGFLLGLHLAARDPLEVVLQKKVVWISMIVAIIAITPVGHWLGKKLTIMAFGKHIQRLKENIDEWKKME